YLRIARETQKFSIGEYQVGRITGKSTVNVAHPIKDRDTGEFFGVVFLALDLNWLNQLAARAELPDGSTLTVIDRKGTLLVRYAVGDSEKDWVGRALTNRHVDSKLLQSGLDA